MNLRSVFLASAALAAGVAAAFAQPVANYQTNVPPDHRRAYFGEMHLHTQMSFDAWTFGTRTTPDQAYKFGRGEPVTVNGVTAQRGWPLDFMAVTDHSEFMGAIAQLNDPNSAFSKTATGRDIRAGGLKSFIVLAHQLHTKPTPPDIANAASASHAWDVQMKATQDNYEPGRFTTILAYEWTGSSAEGGNLHRNVFFNSDRAPAPFSSADSNIADDLWDYLDSVRARGIDAIAIPHNGNASGGAMYDWNTYRGNKPMDEAYAQRRAMEEPLTEIVQTKGQSDTVPELSPNDEFANFEVYDHLIAQPTHLSAAHGSYIREAFGRGLIIESRVGANPFKYGLVGASDIHNGLSTSDENAFAGGAFGIDPKTMLPTGAKAKRILTLGSPPIELDADAATGAPVPPVPKENADRPVRGTALENSSGGLTGVWAEDDTRPAIFAALKRKETFATSGTRIRVRAFGGWNYDSRMLAEGNWVARAYAEGVPMGSDLPARPGNAHAPEFILQAAKDPDGANLDRIQVIKLWLSGGEYKEKIFNVALSDDRRVDAQGKVKPVGNTVDLSSGNYTNSIGATTLEIVWTDPEFDPKTPAVYYTRTLEIPTPRWSTLLAVKNHLPIPDGVPATIQERAWTSPIWYTPAKT